MRKFLKRGSAKEIYELLLKSTESDQWYLKIPIQNKEDDNKKEVVNLNHTKAINYLAWFVCLIPIHPENTSEEEIITWFPDIIEMLKKYSSNSLVAVLIIRLIAEISSNFKNFDFSIYHETFEYLLSKEILDSKISSSSSSSESALLKHYAHFIIYSYRTIKCQEINKIKNLDIDAIYRYFETMMHPEHSYKSPCKFV